MCPLQEARQTCTSKVGAHTVNTETRFSGGSVLPIRATQRDNVHGHARPTLSFSPAPVSTEDPEQL